MNKLDPEKLRKYIRRHSRFTQKEIAAHFGCTQALIHYHLKRYDIPYKRKNQNSKLQPEKLQKYVRNHPHDTQAQIADYFGCDQTSVGSALRRYVISYKLKCRHKIKRRNNMELQAEELKKYVDEHPDATQEKIAAHFGRDQSSISDTLKRYGISYRRKDGRDKVPPGELRKYVHEHPGATQGQIAKHFGCDQSSISDALRRYDIPYTRKRRTTK